MNLALVSLVILLAVLFAVVFHRGRQAAERLRLYEDLFTNLHIGIKVWRLEDVDDAASLRLVASNPAATQATGVPIADVLGKTIAEAFPRAVPDGIAEKFADVVRTGTPKDMGEVVYSDARVREGVYSIYAFPLRGGCVGVAFENITKGKLERAAIERRAAYVRLLQEVAMAANEADAADDALRRALESVCRHVGWPVGHVCLRTDGPDVALAATDLWHLDDAERYRALRDASEGLRFRAGVDLPGRVLATGEPAWAIDASGEGLPRAKALGGCGLRAGFAFPVVAGERVAAVLEFYAPYAPVPDRLLLDVMRQAGAQLGRVIERSGAGAAR